MLDIKFVRENPEIVKENIRKKFQDAKLPLVDEVIALDIESRKNKLAADNYRADRNKYSKQIGALMAQGKKDEAEEMKRLVNEQAQALAAADLALAGISCPLPPASSLRMTSTRPSRIISWTTTGIIPARGLYFSRLYSAAWPSAMASLSP